MCFECSPDCCCMLHQADFQTAYSNLIKDNDTPYPSFRPLCCIFWAIHLHNVKYDRRIPRSSGRTLNGTQSVESPMQKCFGFSSGGVEYLVSLYLGFACVHFYNMNWPVKGCWQHFRDIKAVCVFRRKVL